MSENITVSFSALYIQLLQKVRFFQSNFKSLFTYINRSNTKNDRSGNYKVLLSTKMTNTLVQTIRINFCRTLKSSQQTGKINENRRCCSEVIEHILNCPHSIPQPLDVRQHDKDSSHSWCQRQLHTSYSQMTVVECMSLFCPTQSVLRAEASLMVFPESTESQKTADLSRPGLELRIRQAIGKQNHLGRKGL